MGHGDLLEMERKFGKILRTSMDKLPVLNKPEATQAPSCHLPLSGFVSGSAQLVSPGQNVLGLTSFLPPWPAGLSKHSAAVLPSDFY